MGPYHHARAAAAKAALENAGAELRVVQVCSRDHYQWAQLNSDSLEFVTTLFQGRDYMSVKGRDVADRVWQWLDDYNADVVVANGWSVAEARASLSWARKSNRRRAVIMSESKRDDGRRVFWKEWVKRRIISGASAGLVGGEMQAAYLASLGIRRENIFFGYNVVDNDYFCSAADHARAQPPPLQGRPYFFACARFIARKNLDGLLRAYAAYRRIARESAWELVISGSGEEESLLRKICQALGIDGHVYWPGFIQYVDLPHWYAHSGAFIHPAKGEPWGLVVNEAAACGLPLLVASPVGARYEIVQHGLNGLVFDPFSDLSITGALTQISAVSAQKRAEMGAAARRSVSNFGPARFGSGLLAAVRAALGDAGQSSKW